MNLASRDQAGRDHMTKTDGQEDSWDKREDYLRFRRNLNGWSMSVPAAFQIADEFRPVVLVRTLALEVPFGAPLNRGYTGDPPSRSVTFANITLPAISSVVSWSHARTE